MLVLRFLMILPVLTKSELYLFYKNEDSQPNCAISSKPIIEIYDIQDLQYISFSLRVTWLEAKVLCGAYNGQLAKIDNLTKAKNLMKEIENSNIEFDNFWIGGYKQNKLWIWIDGTNIPINATNDFPSWHYQPFGESNQCLAMDRYNHSVPLLINLNCNLKKYFICEKELHVSIKKDLLLPSQSISFNNKIYLLYNYKTTWYKASAFCRIKGYRLAIITTKEEIQLLGKRMIQTRPIFENVWIAGYHIDNYWRWLSTGNIISDGIQFSPWNENYINKTTGCVLLDRHLNKQQFVTTHCQNERQILCETYDPDAVPQSDFTMVPILYQNCSVFLITLELTWDEAFSYCSNRSLYLAETEDEELLKMISQTMSIQIFEIKHVWLGGKLKNSYWIWATSGNKIINCHIDEECVDDKDSNNTNHWHCLNLDGDVDNKPKLYGIECKSRQFFVCMENACSENIGNVAHFEDKPNEQKRRQNIATISPQNGKATAAFTNSKLNNPETITPASSATTVEISVRRQPQVCPTQSLPIILNGKWNIAFFELLTYWEALKKCQNYGGNLANVERNTENSIRERLGNCKETDLWIYKKDYPCARLPTGEIINYGFINRNNLCSNKLGSLCEIDSNPENYTELKVNCKNSTVMFGANILSYADQNWITKQNLSVNFPVCLNSNKFANHFLNWLGEIIEEHAGFLFILDRSTNEYTFENSLLGLSFMEVVLNIFNLNRNLPSGLILFGENAKVAIPYTETDFCKIRRKILRFRIIGGFKNKLSFYINALTEAEDQINKYQLHRRTLIFFISNNINKGEENLSVVRRLQQNHTIFSIGSNRDGLTDLNIIASHYKNNVLLYGFRNYAHMHSLMVFIKYNKGNPAKCAEKKYQMFLNSNIETAKVGEGNQ